MKIRTAVIYSSIDGQTIKICRKLEEILAINNHAVEMFSIENVPSDISAFKKIIIASSIRYGKHNHRIKAFVDDNTEMLEREKSIFVSVSLVARKPDKNTPETNPYVIKFLKSVKWTPDYVGVFAGKLDYKRYSFFDSLMIRLIMMITKGPVNSKTEIEFTDWSKVEEFGKLISEVEIKPVC